MTARRLLGALILIVCLGAPLVEAIDRWDDTLHDGNDTEANLVIVTLCVGVALSVVGTVVGCLRVLSARFNSHVAHFTKAIGAPIMPASPIPSCSPPLALRI